MTGAISLPVGGSSQWFLSFDDHQYYPTYYELHDVAITTDGGFTFTSVWMGDDIPNEQILDPVGPINISDFQGGDIQIAFVYQGNYKDEWGVDNIAIFQGGNTPPDATSLTSPTDGTELTLDQINIISETGLIWQSAEDPDGATVQYRLQLIATNVPDTLDTMLTSTNFWLQHSDFVGIMDSANITQLNISWDIYTSDGASETPSTNGPWSLTVDGSWVLGVDNEMIPKVFALHNSYPNPFNPVTNIRYDIPEISDVTIEIYNLAGQKIKTLVSNEHQPGRYKIQWNATNDLGSPVSTGMYIYRIKAKDFISVKRLLLMK